MWLPGRQRADPSGADDPGACACAGWRAQWPCRLVWGRVGGEQPRVSAACARVARDSLSFT
ncbi:hypothetical protein KTAU_13780 [Thermogemmatispora aurantia]|uniref:Uncharacterized protein n=1 Tax=Thermogemmatispora aurantia TaxID=2045279 RepID=A0A5J4K7T9_9CHLR|nr:hypothetical protein KTAU_13780 [Thermogemmatispora aurantia]